jgi:hypothetical protein
MLVPADEDEGVGGDVHYVTVEQDPDQSPKVCGSTCADEGNVVWTSLGPLPRWVPGPTTRWAPGTTRLALHGT